MSSAKIRIVARLMIVVALAAMTAGCFQPMYAEHTDGTPGLRHARAGTRGRGRPARPAPSADHPVLAPPQQPGHRLGCRPERRILVASSRAGMITRCDWADVGFPRPIRDGSAMSPVLGCAAQFCAVLASVAEDCDPAHWAILRASCRIPVFAARDRDVVSGQLVMPRRLA